MTIQTENGHYPGDLDLRGYARPLPTGLTSVEGSLYLGDYAHPLPAGLTSVGGDLDLGGYAHPLPAGLTSVGGYLDLSDYAHPLPAGFTSVGGFLSLSDYAHPLPAGFTSVGGDLDLRGYAHPLPAGLVRSAPLVPDLDKRILAAIEAGGCLDMTRWHTCKTTHCRAGWAIVLAGEEGAALERKHGPEGAGALIYERSTGRRPNFYAKKEEALKDIKRGAERSPPDR